MKRSGFAAKRYQPTAPVPTRKPLRWGTMAASTAFIGGHPKQNVLVCEPYRSLVRLLPCAHCGHPPPSQFCHADEGKGMGIKTDDRRGWPGCAPHGSHMGCHHLIGMTGTYSKAQRRHLEESYAAWARARIMEAREWPPRLPAWDGRSTNNESSSPT